MTVDQIRKVHRREPFQPFDFFVADGRTLPVEHPECLAIAGRTIAVARRDETIETVDLLLITSIKPRSRE